MSRVHSAGAQKVVGCDRRGKLLVRDSLTGVKPAVSSISLTQCLGFNKGYRSTNRKKKKRETYLIQSLLYVRDFCINDFT